MRTKKQSFFHFPFLEKLLKRARDNEQQPLLSKIRREGTFKPMDVVKINQDEKKPKYNLICIGSTKDSKNRIIVSEKAQSEVHWATTTLSNAPHDIQKKIKVIAADKPRHKRQLTMSSANFTFECLSQIKRQITIFDDGICSDQDVSSMPTHQVRFDDGIFFLLSLITTIFNHSSLLDANQLVNILMPFSKNPDIEMQRKCTIQPSRVYHKVMLQTLQFVYAISKRINSLMKDCNGPQDHMDVCQGKALFDVVSGYDVNTKKGRNELYMLIFDKKNGAIGGIFEDMKQFATLYPKENKIFQNGVEQMMYE